MLEKQLGETTINTNSSSSSSLFAFVPRQVTLAQHQGMKKSSKTLENGSIAVVVEPTKKKKKRSKNGDPSPLLLSIAAYLQGKGFTQTLAKFQDEASIGEFEGSKVHTLDLEMYYKYLETRKCVANNGSEAFGILTDGITEDQEESKCANPEEPSVKKKNSNVGLAGKADKQSGDSNGFIKSVSDSDDKSTKSHVKKKKSKLGSDSFDENSRDISSETILGSTDKIIPEIQLNELDKKSKDKKKKSKSIVAENDESETRSFEGKSTSENNDNILLDEKKSKSKDKKRKKKSESLDDHDTKEFDQIDIGRNGSDASAFNSTVNVDKTSSKKRKKLDSEGKESHPEIDGRQTLAVSVEKEKANELLETDGRANKKRKTENGQVGLTNTDVHANGDLEKNGIEGSAQLKSSKKQQNGSAEPKTVNAFRRVKIDEVEFADDRLQDNSYWAKHGAEVGYGAKAQEVLGQVRGRDFRHEKTKKKRGSYRGGQIDLQTHSIKFNYSDEE